MAESLNLSFHCGCCGNVFPLIGDVGIRPSLIARFVVARYDGPVESWLVLVSRFGSGSSDPGETTTERYDRVIIVCILILRFLLRWEWSRG